MRTIQQMRPGWTWFALAALSGCSVYDPSLLDQGSSPDTGVADTGLGDSAVADTGSDARSGNDAGGEDSGANDGGLPPLCSPGLDSDCPMICPETCNGLDDDCDLTVDEGTAAELCMLNNAEALCVAGACLITNCTGSFSNCNAMAEDGCEARLDSPEHCGICFNTCTYTNALGACTESQCGFGECLPGFADCDGDNLSCETPTTTLENCGACGATCDPIDNGIVGCADGACGVAECDNGFGDCDDDPSNGCETNLLDTLAHCGTCDNACFFATAEASCSAGFCVPGMCTGGSADCNGDPDDGCEVNALTDEDNCGSCGGTCSASQFANTTTAECVNGVCGPSVCAPNFADCDDNPANGCETSLRTTTNCGACNTACAYDHAQTSCSTGTCELTECEALWGDCNNLDADGCERPTNTLSDCGTCNQDCTSSNGTPSCASGVCSIANCTAPSADCNGLIGDACETNTNTSMAHCGGCNSVCDANATNGTRVCSGGQCVLTCGAGFGDCDGNTANGCETRLNTLSDCGACGQTCSRSNAGASCSTGSCVMGACNPGFGNCDGNANNGCERPLNTLTDCNGCGDVCDFENAGEACVSGTCNLTQCSAGFGNCDGNASNGCERPLNTLTNCNACGVTCDLANASETCATGTCRVNQCSSGFANCDANDMNGCETSTTTTTNCGACGAVCDYANASESCSTGSCALGNCTNGFGNCDGNAANGCERSTTTVTDCGGCNVACTRANAQTSCGTGTCALSSCNTGFGNCDSNDENGCERTLGTNTNCGACNDACTGTDTCVNFQCRGAYPYTTSNFDPVGIASTATVTLNCGVSTFNSATLAFGNWCGQPTPSVTMRAQSGGPDVIVLGFDSLTITATHSLKLDGDKPVILAVFGDATINGTVNASATANTSGPSGVTCSGTAGTNDGDQDDGATGGGGGGFGTVGGNGGGGDGGPGAVAGGAVAGNAQLVPLRGGCAGGRGGNGHPSNNLGREGGGAGGAVQMSVAGTLTLGSTAVVAAVGGGGRKGGSHEDGGGGGGSGGAILLEANNVSIASGAWITANGGSGAGGNDSDAANGGDGNNGNLNNATAAVGGTSDAGGRGGNGGVGTSAGANGGNGGSEGCGFLCTRRGAGGGGGGGGAGRVRVRSSGPCALSASQSPSASRGGTCILPASDCVQRAHNGHGYWFCPTGIGWATASGLCVQSSMRLARIDTMAENEFIRTNAPTMATEIAIGANDIAVSNEWRWEGSNDIFWMGLSDGAAVGGRYSNWNAGEPNNYDHGNGVFEECGYLNVATGGWNDNLCTGASPYVCESP